MPASAEALIYALLAAVMICVGCVAVAAYCAARCQSSERQTHRALTAIAQAADEVRRRGVHIADIERRADARESRRDGRA